MLDPGVRHPVGRWGRERRVEMPFTIPPYDQRREFNLLRNDALSYGVSEARAVRVDGGAQGAWRSHAFDEVIDHGRGEPVVGQRPANEAEVFPREPPLREPGEKEKEDIPALLDLRPLADLALEADHVNRIQNREPVDALGMLHRRHPRD